MKLLLDSCIWGGVVAEVKAAGHDVLSVAAWAADPGDEEVLAAAYRDRRILVTLDKDFGELAIVRGMPHSGLIRLVGFGARQQGRACLHLLARYGEDLRNAAIITARPGWVRVRQAFDQA